MSKHIMHFMGILAALMTAFPVNLVEADTARYQRSLESLTIPDVVLVNQDGERIRFKALMESDKPVIVDFIYATCTTICPVLSAGFSNLQRKLGPASREIQLVSITIDPEHDTPSHMKAYLERYGAQPGWDFLTGSRRDIDRVMHAFDAYFRSKMDHQPLNFIRQPTSGKWVRLHGLFGSRDFIAECNKAGIL
jgi:protein SCO1/2